MLDVIRLLSVRSVRRRPLRAALVTLGVALGIALFVAIALIQDATTTYFRDSVEAMVGKAKITVTAGEQGLDEAWVDKLEKVDGVHKAVGAVQGRGWIGKETVVVLGVDLLRESALRSYKSSQDGGTIDDPVVFLNQDDSILVTDGFARAHGLAEGTRFELMTSDGRRTFVVRGTLAEEGAAKAYGGLLAVMDIDAARVAFGKEGRVDRIDVVLRPDVDEGALVARIAAELPPGYAVERRADQVKGFEKMTASYQAMLASMSGLALIIAIFIVSTTMKLAVAERRREIGMLRAIGATRGVVLVCFLIEAVALSGIGSVIGIGIGRALAELLVGSVATSMAGRIGTSVGVAPLVLGRGQIAVALTTGIFSGIIAGILPAYRAARVSPVEALRANESAPGRTSREHATPAIGVALLLYIGVVAIFHLDERFVAVQRTSLLVGLVGSLLATPLLSLPVARFAQLACTHGPLARIPSLRLAASSLFFHRQRTRAAGMSMVVGLVLVVVLATVQHSFRRTLDDAAGKLLTADLWVSSGEGFMTFQADPVRQEMGDEIAAAAGLDRDHDVRAQRTVKLNHQGKVLALKAWDRIEDRLPFIVTDRPATDAARELYEADGPPRVLVSESFVRRFGKKTGDIVELDTPTGRVPFRIVGQIFETAAPDGCLYIDRAVYRRLWRDDLVTVFVVFLPKGRDPLEARAAIDERVGRRGLTVQLSESVRESVRQFVDDNFALAHAIELAAFLVGMLGLLNSVLVSMTARSRELASLRAAGMTRGQLRGMVLLETMMLGIVAAIAAALGGGYLARIWLGGFVAADLGPQAVQIHFPWATVLHLLVAGTLAGALAGLAAAHRVGKIPLREALATD